MSCFSQKTSGNKKIRERKRGGGNIENGKTRVLIAFLTFLPPEFAMHVAFLSKLLILNFREVMLYGVSDFRWRQMRNCRPDL